MLKKNISNFQIQKERINTEKNNQGFISILLLLTLPILISLILFFFITESVLLIQKKNLEICRSKGIQIYQDMAKDLNRLFELNPKVLKLRNELKNLETKKAAAIASGQLELVSAIEIKINMLRLKQIKLDTQQKIIIIKINQESNSKSSKLISDISFQLKKVESQMTGFINIISSTEKNAFISLQIKPDIVGIAPVYETEDNFTLKQAKEWSWQWNIQPHPIWKRWLTYNWKGSQKCEISLKHLNNQFLPIMLEVRS